MSPFAPTIARREAVEVRGNKSPLVLLLSSSMALELGDPVPIPTCEAALPKNVKKIIA